MEVARFRRWPWRRRHPFRRRWRRREDTFDDGEFFGFFFDEVVAIAFGELVDGFFALLDQSLQELDGLGLVELA